MKYAMHHGPTEVVSMKYVMQFRMELSWSQVLTNQSHSFACLP